MRIIDSHTGGEPTRTIIEGGPSLGEGTLAQRALVFGNEHKNFCSAVLLEPRGHDAIVGAYLLPPDDLKNAAAVIYFNPAGNLGMCGHGTIGLAVTLAHMGRIGLGKHTIETPVGAVEVELHDKNTVSVVNVESYRYAKDVVVDVPNFGPIKGDVAWGGNWFFLTKDDRFPLQPNRIKELTDISVQIGHSLAAQGITGRDGALIDHIEIFGPAVLPDADGRNFVLCPGGAYDRSPCGTGSSAKLACLAADGHLAPGEEWVQESIISSTYRLSYQPGNNGGIIPKITGKAFVTSEATLIFDAADPYLNGIVLS